MTIKYDVDRVGKKQCKLEKENSLTPVLEGRNTKVELEEIQLFLRYKYFTTLQSSSFGVVQFIYINISYNHVRSDSRRSAWKILPWRQNSSVDKEQGKSFVQVFWNR